VAKRHHDLPAGRPQRLSDRLHGRLFRYITSLGLYRSQTAAHVLETYRRGIAEYGVPKEMLTDNGRQYTNWRGKTRFEREMKKDRVQAHPLPSPPSHDLGQNRALLEKIQTSFSSAPSSTASSRPWSEPFSG
jgi:hypothetical protein